MKLNQSRKKQRWLPVILLAFLQLQISTQVLCADWPEHRGNCQRTGYREQELNATDWQPLWRFDQIAPPQPAWPAPARGSLWQKLDHIAARVIDDQGDVPLIASDRAGEHHVLVTSSANDRLVSLDPDSGEVQWQVVTLAPIRYAPSIANGVAYLGADDGLIRAIDIANGAELWQTRIGPEMPWVVGNGRLISPHPLRTSVLVQGDALFATAGLFPGQGVYSVALDAASGDVIWRRRIKQSPQGYLLADENKVFVPTGRTQPFAIEKESGRFLFDLPSPGGSFCMLTPEAFFAGPGNNGTILAKPKGADAKMLSFRGKQVVAGGGFIWTTHAGKLTSISMDAVSRNDLSPEWSVDCELDKSLIVSGTPEKLVAFVAGKNKIELYDAINGNRLVSLKADRRDEEFVYIAVSKHPKTGGELLVATTDSGAVYAWKGITQPKAKPDAPKAAIQQKELHLLATKPDLRKVSLVTKQLKSPSGFALLIGDTNGGLAEALLQSSELKIISIVENVDVATYLQEKFLARGLYGHRVAVRILNPNSSLPFSEGIFNVLVEKEKSSFQPEDLKSMVAPAYGLYWLAGDDAPKIAPAQKGVGLWRHQYSTPANGADSRDEIVGNASAFRLLWFGGVGPSRMPDRHLRGPAPLVALGVVVMQGDGVLIGVDPANGTERWQLDLPKKAMRYVTPFDGGYACLSEDGTNLFVAANSELWQVDAWSGKVLNKIPGQTKELKWGYVAEDAGHVYASLMKPTAPRTAADRKTRYTYVDSDYRSERPLVTSRQLVQLTQNGVQNWIYRAKGVIAHATIALDSGRILFVESRSPECVSHETDRIEMSLLMQDAHLVCIDVSTGKISWERSLKWDTARNMLYLQLDGDKAILTSSKSTGDKAEYVVKVVSNTTGELVWERTHLHTRSGLFHGEQVHHPVVLHRTGGQSVLVAEPYLYDLETGERTVPGGKQNDWSLIRPGHSCGTLSGAGDHLFFRAGNPTVLNLSSGEFTPLAPTRAGCWINMIPAGGRLLIPEASASCVCNYSIQTSMGFAPVHRDATETAIPILPDMIPNEKPLAK